MTKDAISREDFDIVCNAVYAEFLRAHRTHGAYGTAHHGYAVIKEELDELWDEIKADNLHRACGEALEVAASAIRFVADLGGR